MCSLFGLIDHENMLTAKMKNRILNALARESECRGTDATGIAYNFGGRLRIFKRPLPAHRLKLYVPNGVRVVMGHTRMTTQGSEKRNYNNHPFPGSCAGKSFALAHNGVLWNDAELQRDLPKTNIRTDSYAAVQLLEKQKALNFASLKDMAEKVEGSFVFTVLDNADILYIVKGENPICIYCYNGFLLYASTEEILCKAVRRLRLGLPYATKQPKEGDILRIDHTGHITASSFIPYHTYRHWWRHAPYYGSFSLEEDAMASDLINTAKSMGVSPNEVQTLLDYGCSAAEIEELLYAPSLFHELTSELSYTY